MFPFEMSYGQDSNVLVILFKEEMVTVQICVVRTSTWN